MGEAHKSSLDSHQAALHLTECTVDKGRGDRVLQDTARVSL